MIVSMLQAVPLAATTSSKVDQQESISAGVPSPDGDSDRDSHEPVESNKVRQLHFAFNGVLYQRFFVGVSLFDKDVLIVPQRLKANIEKGQFSCQTCNKSYSRIENLTRHSATHDAVSRFQCTICGKRFTRRSVPVYVLYSYVLALRNFGVQCAVSVITIGPHTMYNSINFRAYL